MDFIKFQIRLRVAMPGARILKPAFDLRYIVDRNLDTIGVYNEEAGVLVIRRQYIHGLKAVSACLLHGIPYLVQDLSQATDCYSSLKKS